MFVGTDFGRATAGSISGIKKTLYPAVKLCCWRRRLRARLPAVWAAQVHVAAKDVDTSDIVRCNASKP